MARLTTDPPDITVAVDFDIKHQLKTILESTVYNLINMLHAILSLCDAFFRFLKSIAKKM